MKRTVPTAATEELHAVYTELHHRRRIRLRGHMTATFSTQTLVSPAFVEAGRVDDLPEGEALRITPPGTAPIAVFNVEGEYFAIDDTCTHQDASLSEGWVEDCAVECPLHTACFDLRTGAALGAPAKIPVRTHSVHVEDGVIRVAVSP